MNHQCGQENTARHSIQKDSWGNTTYESMHHAHHESTPCIKRAEKRRPNPTRKRIRADYNQRPPDKTVCRSSSSVSPNPIHKIRENAIADVRQNFHASLELVTEGKFSSPSVRLSYLTSFERTVWELICLTARLLFKPKSLHWQSGHHDNHRSIITRQWQWINNPPTELKASGNPKNYITTEKQ